MSLVMVSRNYDGGFYPVTRYARSTMLSICTAYVEVSMSYLLSSVLLTYCRVVCNPSCMNAGRLLPDLTAGSSYMAH